MTWFEKLGFDSNPFSTDLDFSAGHAVALEQHLDELAYYVASGGFVFVKAGRGSGKSVLLRKLANRLGDRTVYAECSSGRFDVRSLMQSRRSFVDKLLGRNARKVVLLLDNVSGLSSKEHERLKYYYDGNMVESVVVTGSDEDRKTLPPAILDRIGSRVMELHALDEEEAVLLVRRRLGSSHVLEDSVVRSIYSASEGNVKRFLQLCEKACEAAVASNASKITEEHLSSVGVKHKKDSIKSEVLST